MCFPSFGVGNPALNKTLREDWGFEGYITSDSDSCDCVSLTPHMPACKPGLILPVARHTCTTTTDPLTVEYAHPSVHPRTNFDHARACPFINSKAPAWIWFLSQIWSQHHFEPNASLAARDCLMGGTDIDSGGTYSGEGMTLPMPLL